MNRSTRIKEELTTIKNIIMLYQKNVDAYPYAQVDARIIIGSPDAELRDD